MRRLDRRRTTFTDHTGRRTIEAEVIEEAPLRSFRATSVRMQWLLAETAETLDMELALLGHVNAERYTVVGFHARGSSAMSIGHVIPIGETYCRQELTASRPFVLGDATLDADFAEHPGYTRHGLRAYVGAALRLSDGTFFGTLCGVDSRPRFPSLDAIERFVEIAEEVAEEVERGLHADESITHLR